MARSKRDIETNRQISITCIVLLSIILVVFIFLSIILLFSKTGASKKIESIKTQIETITYENGEIEDQIEVNEELIYIAGNPSIYLENLKNDYKYLLQTVEDDVKKTGATFNIAYLNIILPSNNNLNTILNTLKENKILANFYTNNNEYIETITKDGHLAGLYFDDINEIENAYEDNKDIIDKYNIDLYMIDNSISEEEIEITNLKQVKENSTSEDKKQLTQDAYTNNIIKTTANRAFLIIKINADNQIAVDALPSIIKGLKDKNYIFLPLISDSSIFE